MPLVRPPSGSIFVGRKREMEELRTAADDACSGRGCVFLLVGEPGIGKTRTAEELTAYAQKSGAHVLWGRCHEGLGAPAYWPWAQVIRTYAYQCEPDLLRSEMGPGAVDIADVVPGIRERLPGLALPPPGSPEQLRFRLFDSVAGFLREAGNRRPMAVVLDDLHWADRPSLLLLRFLARELRDMHLLIVGTYRDVKVHRHHPFSDVLADLAGSPCCRRVLLQGLKEADLVGLIEHYAGTRPSEAVAATIYHRTEGNPFFANEVVQLLVTEGRLDAAGDMARDFGIPESVRHVITRRLDHLSDDCNKVLTVGAAMGREFDGAVVARVRKLSSERLLGLMQAPMAARIVSELPQAAGHYRFSHVLVRETIYDALTPTERVRLHRRIGETLEQLSTGRSPADLAQRAHHFLAAGQRADIAKGADYARRGGDSAFARRAYEEAARLYAMALEGTERTEPVDEALRCKALLALGEAYRMAWESAKAREAFRRAAESARKSGAAESLAQAALGFAPPLVAGAADRAAVMLLTEALEALPRRDGTLRVLVAARLAAQLYFSLTGECANSLSQEAFQMARRLGDRRALLSALIARFWVLWLDETVPDRLAAATAILRLARELDDGEMSLTGHRFRIAALLEAGDIAGVDAEIEALDQVVAESRLRPNAQIARVYRAMRALIDGRFADADELSRQGLTLGQQFSPRAAAQWFAVQLFALRREQGRLPELESAIGDLSEQNPSIHAWRAALAYVYAESGRTVEAEHTLERLAANEFANVPRDLFWLVTMTLLAETCTALGDVERTATLYRLLLHHAGRNVVVGWGASACHGPTAHYLGLLATTLSWWDQAVCHFDDALETSARMGARPFTARTQLEYAHMLLARNSPGDADRAQHLLSRAHAAAQALGMQGLVERAARLAHGIRSVTTARTPLSSHRLAAVGQDGEPDVPRPEQRAEPEQNVFGREGDYWTITYQGRVSRLRDAKGLSYIVELLQHPARQFHVMDLLVESGEGTASRACQMDSGAGPMIDARARREYRQRLAALREELEEAEGFNDAGRTSQLRAEIEFVTQELAAALGLHGSPRTVATSAERARVAVTLRIRRALKKIAAIDPALGHHLGTTIKTGRFCVYEPDPTRRVSWVG